MAIGKQLSDLNSQGTALGQSATDTISFYGVTPIAQRSSAVQAASVVSVSSLMSVLASQVAWQLEVTNTLIALGLWKGSS